MRLQGLRPEAHIPICPTSCASKRDHFKILKHMQKNTTSVPPLGVGCGGGGGGGGMAPLSPSADAHAYCNECVLSVDCRLRFNFFTIFKANGLISSGWAKYFSGREASPPGSGLATALFQDLQKGIIKFLSEGPVRVK